jgi:hypothetical protein
MSDSDSPSLMQAANDPIAPSRGIPWEDIKVQIASRWGIFYVILIKNYFTFFDS